MKQKVNKKLAFLSSDMSPFLACHFYIYLIVIVDLGVYDYFGACQGISCHQKLRFLQ